LRSPDNNYINSVFVASAFATQGAIINSMDVAENMTGHKGFSVKALPYDRLREIMKQDNQLQ
jgi:D-aminopeptidase